ncbi:G-protein coupled receptor 15-like [Latimeria chalumnae]|uniref:G-protein coupled receptor 15-like n=1 Tax=Latimeria chalumnae TaxID=7897 RepID=UPI00313ED4D1
MENQSLEPQYDDYAYATVSLEVESNARVSDTIFKWFIIVVYWAVFCIGTMGNIAVLFTLIKKRSRRLADVFIRHLAIADFVFLLTLPLWAISMTHSYWIFGQFLCKLSAYILSVNMYSTVFFLTWMSIDRYLAITLLMQSRCRRTKNYANRLSMIVWLLSLVLGTPALIYRSLDDDLACSEIEAKIKTIFNIATRFIAFIIPLSIITVCYCAIAVRLTKHFGRLKKEQKKERDSIKTGLWIVLMFIISWLPYNVFMIINIMTKSYLSKLESAHISSRAQAVVRIGVNIGTCLAFSNSCVNPIIYLVFDHSFRRNLLKIFPAMLAKRLTRVSLGSVTSDLVGETVSREARLSISVLKE